MKSISQVARLSDCPETIDEARTIIDEQAATLAAYAADLRKQRAEVERLEMANADLEIEVKRAGLWAANLEMHLFKVRRAAEAFIKGVALAPWKANEPRVVGFKLEFDELVTAIAEKQPTLPSAETVKSAVGR